MEVVDGKQEVLKSLSQPLQRKEKGKRKKLAPTSIFSRHSYNLWCCLIILGHHSFRKCSSISRMGHACGPSLHNLICGAPTPSGSGACCPAAPSLVQELLVAAAAAAASSLASKLRTTAAPRVQRMARWQAGQAGRAPASGHHIA